MSTVHAQSKCWFCKNARSNICKFHDIYLPWEERIAVASKVEEIFTNSVSGKSKVSLYIVLDCKNFEASRDLTSPPKKRLRKPKPKPMAIFPDKKTCIPMPINSSFKEKKSAKQVEPKHYLEKKPTVTTIPKIKVCLICGEPTRGKDTCDSLICKAFRRRVSVKDEMEALSI